MLFSDLINAFQWWAIIFFIGIVFTPITTLFFHNFFDKGYIFAKIIGIGLISYAVFILGFLKILPFETLNVFLITGGFLLLNIFILKKENPIFKMGLKPLLPIFIIEEVIFLSILLFWAFIHAHAPDIHGLEKYMDYGFINSISRAEYFPPLDMWFTPFSINYYYFGHLTTAVLTKLSLLPSSITFNLMLSAISALTFVSSFSIGANLINIFKKNEGKKKFYILMLAGLLTGFIVSFAGNLQIIYSFFKPYENENPVPFWQLAFSPNTFPNSYWYPNSTRFIENTIHEFPIYSSVVSDLHGHVLDIPFVLLTLAVLLSLVFKAKLKFGNLLLISFLLAVMYMANAWDGIIYFLLTAIVIFIIQLKSATNSYNYKSIKYFVLSTMQNKKYILYTAYYILLMLVGFFIFSLPFNLNFKPFASGIGILCAPEFLTKIGKIGPFLFEANHCQHSPWWQLMILYGFFYFWATSFILFLLKNKNPKHEARNPKQYQNSSVQNSKRFGNLNFGYLNLFRISNLRFRISLSDLFVLILIFLSTLLIIIPEFIYVKDIYPGHYRANTMFKLVYQSFIMLSICSGYIIIRLFLSWRFKIINWRFAYWIIGSIGLLLVSVYPYLAVNSYFGNLKTYYGLDGTKYLKALYPTDYDAILWINKNIKGQPVILEAQGDSYTDYGRISTNTGLPTVLGWAVHEWLWRGTYDVPSPRIPEVQTLYETENIEDAKKLIDKYKIQLIFIGDLEHQKYPKLNEEKFRTLGKVIYENGDTKIYQINN